MTRLKSHFSDSCDVLSGDQVELKASTELGTWCGRTILVNSIGQRNIELKRCAIRILNDGNKSNIRGLIYTTAETNLVTTVFPEPGTP